MIYNHHITNLCRNKKPHTRGTTSPGQHQQPYTPEQQQQQPYSQTNEEEPYYISKTNNPYTFYVPD
jgi:hypothetical protein